MAVMVESRLATLAGSTIDSLNRGAIMGLPGTSGPEHAGESPWAVPLRAAFEALAQRDLGAAVRAWDDAHLAALGSSRWEGLLEVGDAYLRIGQTLGSRWASEPTARKAYSAALSRACQRPSFDGVLRIAHAFADLGDRQAVDECVSLAQLLADDDGARERVQAFLGRVSSAGPAESLANVPMFAHAAV